MTTTHYGSPLLSISTFNQTPSILPLHGFKQVSATIKGRSFCLTAKPHGSFQSRKPNILCAMNMAAGGSSNPNKLNLGNFMNRARKLWDDSPEPVKKFPWNRVLENFIQLVLDLFLVVVKYLSIPLLAISSLSEMSYCAHERKLFLVPIPLLIGMAMADILRQTALELSPLLKDAEAKVPWHLIAIAVFFTQIAWSLLSVLWSAIYSSHCKWGTTQGSLVGLFLVQKTDKTIKQCRRMIITKISMRFSFLAMTKVKIKFMVSWRITQRWSWR